jgi:hypothetical protein
MAQKYPTTFSQAPVYSNYTMVGSKWDLVKTATGWTVAVFHAYSKLIVFCHQLRGEVCCIRSAFAVILCKSTSL